jgi:hypothetical protein
LDGATNEQRSEINIDTKVSGNKQTDRLFTMNIPLTERQPMKHRKAARLQAGWMWVARGWKMGCGDGKRVARDGYGWRRTETGLRRDGKRVAID